VHALYNFSQALHPVVNSHEVQPYIELLYLQVQILKEQFGTLSS